MTALAERRYEEALALIADLPPAQSTEKRRIAIEALRGLGRHRHLVELLNPPQNIDEAVEVVSLLLGARRFDDARERLQTAKSLLTPSLFAELRATIDASQMSE